MKQKSRRVYGQTKIDHVLSYMFYSIEDACILVGAIAGLYVFIHWATDFIVNWIYCNMM